MKKVSFIILLVLILITQINFTDLKKTALSIEKGKIILINSNKKNILDTFKVSKDEEIKDYCFIVTTQYPVENAGNRETISVHLNAEIRNWKLEIKRSHTNFQFSCRE